MPQEGFIEALKAFIKLLEATQRSVKIKVLVNFLSSFGIETGRVTEKLTYPGENDRLVNFVKNFPIPIPNELILIFKFPNWMIPDCDAHSLTLLDLFLSTNTTICSAATLF